MNIGLEVFSYVFERASVGPRAISIGFTVELVVRFAVRLIGVVLDAVKYGVQNPPMRRPRSPLSPGPVIWNPRERALELLHMISLAVSNFLFKCHDGPEPDMSTVTDP